jgi:hypothetical protein
MGELVKKESGEVTERRQPAAMLAAWKDEWGRVGFTVKGLSKENRDALFTALEDYMAYCRAADKMESYPAVKELA